MRMEEKQESPLTATDWASIYWKREWELQWEQDILRKLLEMRLDYAQSWLYGITYIYKETCLCNYVKIIGWKGHIAVQSSTAHDWLLKLWI